jgi:uncharacterized protein (TIGR02466 family)
MNLNKIFYTPVWTEIIDSVSDTHLAGVRSFCMSERNKEPGKIASNNGGWQSEDYFYYQLKDTPLKIILDIILDNMNACMKELGSSETIKFANIWMNINSAGDSNKLHNHGGVLSGTFYVKTPPQSGSLYVSRAFDLENWFYGSIMSIHNTELSATEMYFQPTEKMLVVFPSWVPHGVTSHNSPEERISISFNTQLDSGE